MIFVDIKQSLLLSPYDSLLLVLDISCCIHSMKQLGALLLPSLDGMLVHSKLNPAFCQVVPTICRYPFIHLCGERRCESKVTCPRTQHCDPGQDLNPDHLICAVL